jgi:hypothetical protein
MSNIELGFIAIGIWLFFFFELKLIPFLIDKKMERNLKKLNAKREQQGNPYTNPTLRNYLGLGSYANRKPYTKGYTSKNYNSIVKEYTQDNTKKDENKNSNYNTKNKTNTDTNDYINIDKKEDNEEYVVKYKNFNVSREEMNRLFE